MVHPELLTGSGTSGEAGEAEARLPGDDLQRHSATYLAGVALCLYTAAAVSVSNVVQISVTQPAASAWTKDHLMVVAGETPRPGPGSCDHGTFQECGVSCSPPWPPPRSCLPTGC